MNPTEALDKLAQGVQSDINGDNPELRLDTNYDLWVEELRDDRGVRQTVGVIDMGDCYQGVYTWDGRSWEHDYAFGDPQDVIDRIIKAREHYSSGH